MSINNNSKAIIMKMSPLEVTRLIIYIILYPIVTLFRWLLLALTPIMHLLQLLLSGFRIPLRILASLEVSMACNFSWSGHPTNPMHSPSGSTWAPPSSWVSLRGRSCI